MEFTKWHINNMNPSFSYIIKKFTNKLTESEMLFFEKFFSQPEIIQHFESLQKQFYKFLFIKVVFIATLLIITVWGFFIDVGYGLWAILINTFLLLWYVWYRQKQREKFHETNLGVMEWFFRSIYEKIFSFEEFQSKTPNTNEKSEKKAWWNRQNHSFDVGDLVDENSLTQYQNAEIIFTHFIAYTLSIHMSNFRKGETFMQVDYSLCSQLQTRDNKTRQNFVIENNIYDKKNFYLSVVFGGFLLLMIISFMIITFRNSQDIYSALQIGLIFGVGVFIAFLHIIQYFQQKRKFSHTQNKEFNKNFYLHASNDNSLEPILGLFVDFYNIQKLPTRFSSEKNILKVERKIPLKFFNSPHVSKTKNIERYINVYLEIKKLSEIAKKL